MRVLLTTTARVTRHTPYALSNLCRLVRAADHDRVRRHSVTTVPEEADAIVFVGSQRRFGSDVLRSDFYRDFPNKCVLLDYSDVTAPSLPGLYMGLTPGFEWSDIYQPGFYPRVFENDRLDQIRALGSARWLFSFMGAIDNCPEVRGRLTRLCHPRGLVVDKSLGQSDRNDDDYLASIASSAFVLCPRGLGPSTWRLFEVMRSGRVPVIIADAWAPPRGVDWNEFSIRVRESEIDRIPQLLESREHEAAAMGQAAREAYQRFFSVDGSFDWIAERVRQVLEGAYRRGFSPPGFWPRLNSTRRMHQGVAFLFESLRL
jgi:hypothetical protein